MLHRGGAFKQVRLLSNLPDSRSFSFKSRILHLYRALLRQASYLPDPASKTHFRQYLPVRFRQSYDLQAVPEGIHGKRLDSNRKNFESLLRSLYLANAGRHHHVRKILSLTYGRVGKRRHELLTRLRLSDKPVKVEDGLHDYTDSTASTPARQLKGKARPPGPLSSPLIAVAKSQVLLKDDLFEHGNIKSAELDVKLPKTNAWDRPLPKCRERNLMRANQKHILSRIMPPLPEAEWRRLGDLATGNAKMEEPPRRRARATLREPTEGLAFSYQDKMQTWASEELFERRTLSPRTMRLLWARIWAQTPLLTESENPEKPLRVKWGHVRRNMTVAPGADAAVEMVFQQPSLVVVKPDPWEGKHPCGPYRRTKRFVSIDRRLGV